MGDPETSLDPLCRTCLQQLESTKNNIFLSHISKWLSICTSLFVEENDDLPKYVCDSCYAKIEDFYQFKTMCSKSVEKYYQMIQEHREKLKTENSKIYILEKSNDNISSFENYQEDQKGNNICTENEEVVETFVHIVEIPNFSKNDSIEYIKESEYDTIDMVVEENNGSGNDSWNTLGDESEGNDNNEDDDYHPSNEDDDEDDNDKKKSITRKSEAKKKELFDKIQRKHNKICQQVYVCETCTKRYFKKEKYEACMRSHKGLKPWVCPECKKEYRKKASLITHIKFEHKKECEMYACPVTGCDKKYRLKQTMQVHYKRIHVKDLQYKERKIKSYICEQCGKALKTLNALNQHRFTHSGEFPYKCEQCPKRCGTRYQLEVHMKRHKGIKNFICPICGLKKITQQELNTHMNYHSRNKTFTCKFCPYTSCNNGNVVRHENIVHHGMRTFECKYCGKTFGKSETLKHHVMIHTGEKPHKCHLCERKFIQPTALKTHLKRHDKGTIKATTVMKKEETVS